MEEVLAEGGREDLRLRGNAMHSSQKSKLDGDFGCNGSGREGESNRGEEAGGPMAIPRALPANGCAWRVRSVVVWLWA